MPALPARAVTFDFGHTLCDLDTAMLSSRLAERGLAVPADRLEASVKASSAYDTAVAATGGGDPWKSKMCRLLALAGASGPAAIAAVDWLWTEQPHKSLWRRPIAGMIELVRGLRCAGVPVGIVSNSRGRLAELTRELGWGSDFLAVVDSGKLGIEKPDPGIFRWAAAQLGASPERVVHVGDSYAIDIEGAHSAGMRAVWFRGKDEKVLPHDVRLAGDAAEVRIALTAFGLPGG